MDQDRLVALLSAIVGNQRIKRSGQNHVNVPCLMSPWRHASGQDRRPSMTISHGVGPSFVTCWACDYKKPLSSMLFELNVLRNGELAKIAIEAQKIESVPYYKPLEYSSVSAANPDDCRESVEMLQALPWTKDALEFIHAKGVSFEAATSAGWACMPAGTTIDLPNKDDPVAVTADTLIFPMITKISGALRCIGASARSLSTYGAKYYHILPFQSESYLYMEADLATVQGRAVALVEGYFDAIHLRQEGIPAFGLFGTKLSLAKSKKLLASKPALILNLMDNDKAGEIGRIYNENLLKNLGLSVLSPVLERDPKYYTKTQLQTLVPQIEL